MDLSRPPTQAGHQLPRKWQKNRHAKHGAATACLPCQFVRVGGYCDSVPALNRKTAHSDSRSPAGTLNEPPRQHSAASHSTDSRACPSAVPCELRTCSFNRHAPRRLLRLHSYDTMARRGQAQSTHPHPANCVFFRDFSGCNTRLSEDQLPPGRTCAAPRNGTIGACR